MSSHYISISPSLFPPIPLSRLQSRPIRYSRNPNSPITCNSHNSESSQQSQHSQQSKHSKHNINTLNLLQISVTLTIISATLPQPVLAAKVANKKKRPVKKIDTLTPQEWKTWSQGLPVVGDRIAYTDLIELKRDGKLKHVVKPSGKGLRERPVVVLAVLEDSKVVRLVVPSMDSDRKFWDAWDELGIDLISVQAYTPPVKTPDVPRPVLGFLSKFPLWMYSFVKPKPVSKKVLELRKQREELKKSRINETMSVKKKMAQMEKAARAQKKTEERKKKMEEQKLNSEQAMLEARLKYYRMSNMWKELARDSNVTLGIGLLFFVIFYQTVVLSYKKQKKDYEDRLKIEKAEAEEKRKMKELERGMAGLEDDDDDGEGKSGEENPYMKMAQQFMKSGARVRRAQNSKNVKLSQYMERGVDVKFSDVAGLGKIRLELEEIVKFFTHGEIYRRRGVKIPGGILLCGPPGVGKTLLAKAVAGEAGVNFFSISASQFVEIYVGVGASRVRALYQEARDCAPSVVFIDELDAVGRERGLIKGSGGQERDATLNQLLVCLDGFEGRGNVITIASTNRPDILDPALVRPGRFDRKIFIPKPGLIGRVEILKVHARKKPMAEDVDYAAVAAMTDGMVGAELANIVEVAAINMMRDGRTEITTDDLLQAAQIEERGMLDKKERSPEMWKQVAINEAAMAVVAINFHDLSNIEFINIAPRAGRELGYVRMKMDHIKFKEGLLSRQSLLDHITVQLAPRAADEMWHGEGQLSTIWAETADNARSAARAFVLGGLSDKYYGVSNFWAADRINDIDLEASRILDLCYGRAKELLDKNRKLMDAIVDALIEKKSLNKQEFLKLVELHGCIQPGPPSILDMRALKQVQMQSVIMKHKEEANRVVT
ncbi:putative peptidase M41, AAA+ ATPase domain, ATPase, AAA-type, core [Helianthus annuus]|uniref:Peptidase M41, AAA+ ATPase domain, ATPase, AAA-type, core n=1 Tax=Helianthus annuus TaxID=4232 RepID=A0A251RVU4_HELAN|nr:probable inactive ATP-dependent zinc metalloprotease FTSHI 2, chloroplastic [Helianthus annuus]KAF5758240.1 putative peptidase M41, AAA+ ATPase domain, ATPase, AAA-type, core [Helianthus annuus]